MSQARGVLYFAGLGDIIRLCYESAGYRYLSEAASPVPVVVASHNPFSIELLRHHRNAGNFILYDLGHKYAEFLKREMHGVELNRALCDFAGVDFEKLVRGPAAGHVPVFDAPDDLPSTGHIVFQPFAGNANYRSLPEPLMEKAVTVLRRLPCPVYLLTRSYVRGVTLDGPLHDVEDARRFAGGNITVLEHLSVPASLNLIKTCRAFVGSWSSLLQAAWFERKPAAVFYPEHYHDVTQRTPYAFGLDRDETLAREFPRFDARELENWLQTWNPAPASRF